MIQLASENDIKRSIHNNITAFNIVWYGVHVIYNSTYCLLPNYLINGSNLYQPAISRVDNGYIIASTAVVAHVRCRKSPFCRAEHHGNHAIVTGKDCKTSYQAVSIDYCLYRTTQYVKVYNILVYLRGYLSYDDFSHRTLDTLALQCSGTNLK